MSASPVEPPASPPAPDPTPAEGLRLQRLKVRNFRNIADVDVNVPEGKQIICLVGPNGSSKSALMSLMVKALRQLMQESAPDEQALFTEGSMRHPRVLSGAEIGPEGSAFGLRMDWSWRKGTLTYHTLVGGWKEDEFVEVLRKEFEVPKRKPFSPLDLKRQDSAGYLSAWANRGAQDPIKTAVFLERPVGRFERPYYEEDGKTSTGLRPLPYVQGHRPFGVRSTSGVDRLESLVLDLLLDERLQTDSYVHRVVDFAVGKIAEGYRRIQNIEPAAQSPLFAVSPWPFRRVGVNGLHALTLLSAGELDVLVTIGELVAQQVYLRRIQGESAADEPSGIVIIDEVDAHLHPQWQQKVLPLYAELFPNVQFVVTTHSPFVLRSLPRDKALVLRLPDGHVFDEDLAAWSIEDILEVVFTVPGRWSEGIKAKLLALQKAASTPGDEDRAIGLYLELALRSPTLRSECDGILALYADAILRDRIVAREKTPA